MGKQHKHDVFSAKSVGAEQEEELMRKLRSPFNALGAQTGRFSCKKPNETNISKRGDIVVVKSRSWWSWLIRWWQSSVWKPKG